MKKILIIIVILVLIFFVWKALSNKNGSEVNPQPVSLEKQQEQMGGPEKPTGFVPKENL